MEIKKMLDGMQFAGIGTKKQESSSNGIIATIGILAGIAMVGLMTLCIL